VSAFIVSQAHIAAMIDSIPITRERTESTPQFQQAYGSYYWHEKRRFFLRKEQEIGQELLHQNYRSVNARYNESTLTPVYKGGSLNRRLSPIEIIKLCHSYNYQSCETGDWEDTEAYAISKAIEGIMVRRIEGYHEAQWAI